jgi:hypothetical protein
MASRLTECDDSGISRHGVSLLSGGSGRLDTRLDTPPSTKRRHPDSGIAHASLVPSLDADIHLVLCRFGRAGLAYIETDPAEADATTVVQNLLHGRYGWPSRVIALNVDEGWSRDVSEAMARKVHEIAEREDYELTEGTLAFMEAHSPRVVQPTLPLW